MKKVLKNWTVTGYWPYATLLNKSVETRVSLRGITKPLDIEYVSDVYTVLRRNGIIPDMYFGNNSLSCEWVSERWWLYENTFTAEEPPEHTHYNLFIEGLDYRGDIHINGKFVCHHICPFIPLKIDLTPYIKYGEENKLSITVYNTPHEYSQYGYTSKSSTQRSRFDYKWDFSTRLVGIGVYGPVYLERVSDTEIVDAFVKPRYVSNDNWEIPTDLEIKCKSDSQSITVKTALCFEKKETVVKEYEIKVIKGSNNLSLPLGVTAPQLWWPNNHGEQPIYSYKISILINGKETEQKQYNIAFRRIEYARADNSPEDSLTYMPVINGKKIYIKGVNLVPFDLVKKFPSKDVYDKAFKLLKEGNINLVRVWGGGILESEYFYDLCDRCGIMVWQEFIQSSSGVDNVPCKNPEFLDLLGKTALSMIKQRRNHISLTFWSGGNELCDEKYIDRDDRNDHPAGYDDRNIAMLHALVKEFDKDTLMLPTSASGPYEFLNNDRKGQNHDVHGPWMYYGTEVHYAQFNGSDSILHSEFGCNGMSSAENLKEFLPKESLKVKAAHEDLLWDLHAGDWWDTTERDTEIFGKFGEDELETLSMCSQFIQAEGVRYAVQSNMRRAMKNCGSIVWQFNEPWPNVSCTSLVSYGLNPKLAYYFLRDSYSPYSVSLKYDKLCWDKGEIFKGEAFIFNEFAPEIGTVKCAVTDMNGTSLLEKEWKLTADTVTKAGLIDFLIPDSLKSGFSVSVEWIPDNKELPNRACEYLILVRDSRSRLCDKNAVIDYFNRNIKKYKA